MRSRTLTASAGAFVLLAASLVEAHKNVHNHVEALHRRHRAHRDLFTSVAETGEEGIELRSVSEATEIVSEAVIEKRGGQCQFPYDAGLVSVTPGEQNAGWAMSPNQPCLPGNYCPYACPPGQVSMQWNPAATSYTYPLSMDGGLYCDENGDISKPLPNNPYCSDGTGTVTASSSAGFVSFCQTVLPGNEAMLIPTSVEALTTLAVPDMSYWCDTAAHFYINPPGVNTDEACVWGTSANPWGNWSPYVAGANTVANGETFIKLGWNPIYLEQATPFRNDMPTWGVEITCSGGECNGLPCAIDPSQNGVNEMVGSATNGAGGGAFCVVTVPAGATANFAVFEGSMANAGSGGSWAASSSASPTPSSTYVPPSTSSSAWSSTSSSTTWGNSAGDFYTSANWTSSSTESWSASSSTSEWAKPSQVYPLFNENSTSTWAASAAALPTQGETSAYAATPAIATHTGSASIIRTSIFSLALSGLTLGAVCL